MFSVWGLLVSILSASVQVLDFKRILWSFIGKCFSPRATPMWDTAVPSNGCWSREPASRCRSTMRASAQIASCSSSTSSHPRSRSSALRSSRWISNPLERRMWVGMIFISLSKYAFQWTESEGSWDFTCQHGPRECYNNKIQACILNQVRNSGIFQSLCISYISRSPTLGSTSPWSGASWAPASSALRIRVWRNLE